VIWSDPSACRIAQFAQSLSLSCASATVYPVRPSYLAHPIEGQTKGQAKELVDSSKINDTIIAHIDSAVLELGKKFCLFGAGATGEVMQLPACMGVIALKEPVQA
jgi:hypothetical protein